MFLIFRNFHDLPPSRVELNDEERHHVRVKRLRGGEEVHVGDGISRRWRGRLGANLREVEMDPGEEGESRHEPVRTLFTAVPAGKRWDWLLQKSVELGVTSIIPVVYRRAARAGVSMERARKIIREAASQSRRYFLPELFDEVEFSEVDRHIPPDARLFVLHNLTDSSITSITLERGGSAGLFVGPEGGFTDEEISQFLMRGIDPVQLGPHVLRVETAALAALSYLMIHS